MNHPDELTNSEQQPSTEQQMVDGETALLEAILESLGNLEANVDLLLRCRYRIVTSLSGFRLSLPCGSQAQAKHEQA